MVERKRCTKCGEVKPISEFSKRYDYPDRTLSACKDCERIRKRDYARKRFKDPGLRRAVSFRQKLWTYGITATEYESLLKESGGECAICQRPFGGEAPRIDHCHTTGKIRGLLCHNCNAALGLFKDSPEVLSRAVEYLNDSRN